MLNARRYKEALDACRAHLTWYVLCHHAHTVPFLRTGRQEARELLDIDIGALATILDTLCSCYRKNGIANEFPSVLTHLSEAIESPRWMEKIVYFRALWAHVDQDDAAQARTELAQLDIRDVSDPKILGLYLDVHNELLGFEERIGLVDKILSVSRDPSYQLQYSAAKGIAFCLIGEMNKGCEMLRAAIAQYRSIGASQDHYSGLLLARALFALAELSSDKPVASQALSAYLELNANANRYEFKTVYFADVTKGIADCHTFLGQYADAIRWYEESLRLESSELTKLFLARAHANASRADRARTLLMDIATTGLSNPDIYDYAISWAVLAVISLEQADLDRARHELKRIKTSSPLFIQQRDAILIDLLEAKPKAQSGRIRRLLVTLNRYVSLNPNLCGIGVNLNKMIEDAEGKSRKAK